MAWLEDQSYLIYSDLFDPITNLPYEVCPRNQLKKADAKLNKLGFSVKGASELEYYFYKKNYAENKKDNYGLNKIDKFGSHAEDYLIQEGDRFDHIYEQFRMKLKESGMTIETTKGEAAAGQHEINVSHDDSMKMCDLILVLKKVLKIYLLILILFSLLK
jgi:glutamine synthetase